MVGGSGSASSAEPTVGHLAVAIPVDIEQLGALGDGYILDLDLLRAAALGGSAGAAGAR